jgi:branched-chain amino acid transport system substrate-binding protein
MESGAMRIKLTIMLSVAFLFSCRFTDNSITIGAILTLTGSNSTVGIAVSNGLTLAVEEVNQSGGIDGRSINLEIMDCESSPGTAVALFDSMVQEHDPIVIVTNNSYISMALTEPAGRHKVPMIGLISSAPEIPFQNEWSFRYYTAADEEVDTITSQVSESAIRSLGVVYLDDPYGQSYLQAIENRFAGSGITISSSGFSSSNPSFADVVSKVSSADAVYMVGFLGHLQGILAMLRDTGYDGDVYAPSTSSLPEFVSDPRSDGVRVAAPAIYNPRFIYNRKVSRIYENQYSLPFNHYSGNGYDIIKIIVSHLQVGAETQQDLRDSLEGDFVHTGVFGVVTKQAGTREILFPTMPAYIKDGTIVYE